MTTDVARDKAARLLKRRGSASSMASADVLRPPDHRHKKAGAGSVSTVSYHDDPGHEDLHMGGHVKMENTYQLAPSTRFPIGSVKGIIRDVLDSYLAEERYSPELCRQMTKTISEVVKARVKELMIPRFKIICLVTIGQLKDQGCRVSSRCLWDPSNDTYASYEFRNSSLFAVGMVFGVYTE
ncbi:tctex1 domain-containing protein 1-B [Lingula anatina]|uniref:Tctex1 domain-containing protein 1-B n=1 Tax=Lingula anatina TaxID=7574 RepID=A0A1S3JC55_LINAN|nr:tctex1 domain-containing protein 1-B [Lingula anatina]|eukprot:XP_013407908.1 tctex1 domain-containing protein 1-B [Lingula anatina]